MSLEELPEFLTVEEAAAVLRIGRTSAYLLPQQWRQSGELCPSIAEHMPFYTQQQEGHRGYILPTSRRGKTPTYLVANEAVSFRRTRSISRLSGLSTSFL